MKKKTTEKTSEPTLAQMPLRLPNDPQAVSLLLDESERLNAMGNRWQAAKHPNLIAAEYCLRNGWAIALAAAWLRCKLKGELLPESEAKKKYDPELAQLKEKMECVLSEKELLKLVPISKRTLATWRQTKKIPYMKIGHRILYHWSTVSEALRRMEK